jgi:hypothetical protein
MIEFVLQTGAAQSVDTRVHGEKTGWTDSLTSGVENVSIPAI